MDNKKSSDLSQSDLNKKPSVPTFTGPAVDYMYVADEEDFADGDTIVKQGKHGNWNWVVLEGTVEIRKETPKGQVPIIRAGIGSFVGSIASLLQHSNVRNATVVSIDTVQLGVLDSQRLSMEYGRLTTEFKEILISLDKRINQTMNRVVEAYVKKKRDTAELIREKSLFIKQGDESNEAYIIDQGEAYVVANTKTGPLLLNTLEEGDVLGNIPFLKIGHEPGSAAIYTTEDFRANVLKMDVLENEYEQLSITFQNMIENASALLAVITKFTRNSHK